MSRTQGFLSAVLLSALVLAFFWWTGPRSPLETQAPAVVEHYADMAHAVFGDAHDAAELLQAAVVRLIENPTREHLQQARQAWIEARVPYMQSEVFRFGNPVVDAWEGQVNAWPLDEGLIDYVKADYVHEGGNVAANANVIGHSSDAPLQLGGQKLDVSTIDADLLVKLNEFGGSEANVATGYHAIEFLLWGQDDNGYNAGAGDRPVTDFATEDERCTRGEQKANSGASCQRRAKYLLSAAEKLVADLAEMRDQWAADMDDNYRAEFLDLPEAEALRRVFLGMGSLALGELAGERMKVALIANSPEDEHDCFSDNTHWSHFHNLRGIANIYRGRYVRRNGETLDGPGVDGMLRPQNDPAANDIDRELQLAQMHMQRLADKAEQGMRFDQMIAPGNDEGARLIRDTIDALVQLAAELESGARALGLHDIQADDAGHSF